MATIYKQANSKWAKKPYPKKCTVGGSGCALVAMTNLLNEYEQYKSATPLTFYSYMVKGSVDGDGTKRAYVTTAMSHYGFKNVIRFGSKPISEAWPLFKKGYRGVFVMSSAGGGSKKTKWTTSGHYIAITNYKEENGKHYLYVKDSSWRNNDGWKTYEENMRGAVSEVIIGDPSGFTKATSASKAVAKATSIAAFDKVAIKNLQKVLGTTQDGIISGQNESMKKYLTGIDQSCVKYAKGGSNMVKKLQEKVGVTVDGYLGPNTNKAVQKLVGVTQDGYWGNGTSKAVTAWVNKQLKAEETPKVEEKPKTEETKSVNELVIDVSYAQKDIDWKKVAAAGVKGAIVRCGYRGYGSGALNNDDYFIKNIQGASKEGLKVGVYFFTEAINAAEGKAEAQFAIKRINEAGVAINYPIAIDTENINAKNPTPRANNLSVAKRTEVIKAFCEEVIKQGYEPMIYASTSWLNNKLNMKQLPYKVWCAQYASKCEYKGEYIMWQYSSDGKVNGITGRVDMNHCYISGVKTVEPVDLNVIAQEVLDGKWGSGVSRKLRLTEAGYDYEKIQSRVNEILKAQEEEKKVKAEEEARLKAEEEAKKKAEEEARLKEEAERLAAEAKDKQITELAQAIIDQFMTSDIDINEVLAKIKELLEKEPEEDIIDEPLPPEEEIIVPAQISQTYQGGLPTTTLKKSNIKVIEDTIKWLTWHAGDNSFHYGYTSKDKKINAHHNGCYYCGTNTLSGGRSKKGIIGWEKTYCCNPFIGAGFAHGGCVPEALKLCRKGTSWDFHKGAGYDTSKVFTKITKPAKISDLPIGAVLCRDTHVAMYIGNGKIVEAGGSDDNVKNSKKWNNSIRVCTLTEANYKNFPRVYKYNSSVNTTVSILPGELSDRVKLWQEFLNWYFGTQVVGVDGEYGDATWKYTKEFQEKELGKGQGDGYIGEKTLQAAAQVKRA